MSGHKESITAFGLTIQPTPQTFNAPVQADLVPISSPDNGFDPITAEDPTLTGSIFAAPRQFLGKRGRAGATLAVRGPGGTTVPNAGAWVPGRILQAAGFTEIRNAAEITAVCQANALTNAMKLDAAASAVDDFYKGMAIRHTGIGVGRIRSTSMIRDYDGASKVAILGETLGAAIAAGNYIIPKQLTYVLGTGLAVPLLSVSVWRHKVRYDYRDCALSSFAINIPVSNDQQTDAPSIEFAMVGTPVRPYDQDAIALQDGILTPPPPAKAGKFVFNGLKIGHQSMRLEFGLETGAPPNQNFDEGQESNEILSGTRGVTLDINQNLIATLDVEGLVDTQASVPILSMWGLDVGNSFGALVPNSYLDPFSPTPRNGFVGLSGAASPSDVDRSIALSCFW